MNLNDQHQHLNDRNKSLHDARAILDRAKAENRSTTAEERGQIDRHMDDYDKHNLDYLESRDAPSPLPLDDAPVLETKTETSDDVIMRMLKGDYGTRDFDTSHIASKMEKRVLLTGTAGDGPELIPEGFIAQIYEFMEYYSAVRQAGATIMTTNSGNDIPMPTLASHAAATWVAENATIAGTDPQFNQVVLKAFKAAQLVKVTNELIEDNAVGLLSFLAKDIGRGIAALTDRAYTIGNGTSQPQGFGNNLAGANTVTSATGVGGKPNFDNLIAMKYILDPGYAMNAVWMMRWDTMGEIAKIKDTDGQYLWQPAKRLGEPDMLLGSRVIPAPNVAAMGTGGTSVYFVDLSSALVIRDVGSMEINTSMHHWFHQDSLAVRATMRTDSRVRDKKAGSLFVGATS